MFKRAHSQTKDSSELPPSPSVNIVQFYRIYFVQFLIVHELILRKMASPKIPTVIGESFVVGAKIGEGTYGQVCKAMMMKGPDMIDVAMKFESKNAPNKVLAQEVTIYKLFKKQTGFAKYFGRGSTKGKPHLNFRHLSHRNKCKLIDRIFRFKTTISWRLNFSTLL